VAVVALDLRVGVPALQRELRLVVVELRRVLPVLLGVTVLALVAFDAPVLVVLLVAADAGRLRLVLVQVDAGVAVLASDLLGVCVLAAQRVLGVAIMVEL